MKKIILVKTLVCLILIIIPVGIVIYSGTKHAMVDEKKKDQLHILVTTSIIADVVKNIVQGAKNKNGKNTVVIHTLMKVGVDPHAYETTIQDANRCNEADVIFVNGLNLEGNMGYIFANLRQVKSVYVVTDVLKERKIRKDTRFSAGVDPHFWGDVRLMSLVVEYIVEILKEIDPYHAELYAKNGEKYQEALNDLYYYISKKIKQLPQDKRIVITTHDFLGYFADAHGVNVQALQGFTTAREITLKRRKDLVQTIIKKKIKAIFSETGVSDRGVKSLLESCKIADYNLRISDRPLYADSIGPLGSPSGSYIGMMKHNVDTIIEELL